MLTTMGLNCDPVDGYSADEVIAVTVTSAQSI